MALATKTAPSGPLKGASARTFRYTVADLRAVLDGLPGDTEVVIDATCDEPCCAEDFEYEVTAAEYERGLLRIVPA